MNKDEFMEQLKVWSAEVLMEQNAAIERVRELHKLGENIVIENTHIIDGKVNNTTYIAVNCSECGDKYPCPTIKALDGEKK